MRDRVQFSTVAVTLLFVVSAVAGATALTGPAAAQSGSIQMQGTITSDTGEFAVTVTSLEGTEFDSGCVVVTNSNREAFFRERGVVEGETVTVSDNDVGGLNPGDEITASLYEFPEQCENQLDADTTTVQEPAFFEVQIDQYDEAVVEGETVTVDYTVTNTGDMSGTQEIRFVVGDTGEATVPDVELAAGESRSGTFNYQTGDGDAPGVLVMVETDDSARERQVQVEESPPALFEVAIVKTNSPVPEGGTLEAVATIENVGDGGETQQVDFLINGETVDIATVSLAAGDVTTETFEWVTEEGSADGYVATVESGNDSDSVDVTVKESAVMQVTVDSTNTPVTEGDTLEVQATVENIGEVTGSKDVRLAIDGTTVDTLPVDLEPGESTAVTLRWESESGDAGVYNARVSSDSTSDSTGVRVAEPGSFTVGINETTSPVAEGSSLDVTATVTNTGESSATQSAELTIDGEIVDAVTVALDSGESQTVTLSWATEAGDRGEHTATVRSDDDSESVPVTVTEPPEFAVDIEETNSPVAEGATLDVTATVENVGGAADTQPIRLRTDGTERDSRPVSLDSGESTTVTLSWATANGDAGEYTAAVASDNDTATTGVTVGASSGTGGDGGLEVTIESTNTPVQEGQAVEVTAQVANTGSDERTEEVTLRSAGAARDSQTVTLSGGDSTTVTFVWETEPGDAGEYTATVAGETDDATTTVTVEQASQGPDSTFAVTIDGVSTPDDGSGSFEVTTTIENTGETADTQTITLTSGGTERGSQELSLSSGESQSITFSWEQSGGTEVDIQVSSETDQDSSQASLNGGGDGPVSTASLLLLLLLILILLGAYYYVRRRQREEATYAEDDTQQQAEQEQQPPDTPPPQTGRDGPEPANDRPRDGSASRRRGRPPDSPEGQDRDKNE